MDLVGIFSLSSGHFYEKYHYDSTKKLINIRKIVYFSILLIFVHKILQYMLANAKVQDNKEHHKCGVMLYVK